MIFRCIGLCLLLSSGSAVWAQEAPRGDLDKLFNTGKFEELHKVAPPLAQRGDAEAQYMMGKLYHLGKGVEKNIDAAKQYYLLSAAQDNKRALNNLGVIAHNHDHLPDVGMKYLQRALALGSQTPTRYAIGTIHLQYCKGGESIKACEEAGDIFVKGYHENLAPLNPREWITEAATAYAAGCATVNRQTSPAPDEGKRPQAPDLCRLAVEWADKGVALTALPSIYVRGLIEENAGRHDAAAKWYALANEKGSGFLIVPEDQLAVGKAAYKLGKMYRAGKGVPQDDVKALALLQRGAELANPQAKQLMITYWNAKMMSVFDPAQLTPVLRELARLHSADNNVEEGLFRLQLVEALARNARVLPALVKQGTAPSFCFPEEYEMKGQQWSMYTVSSAEQALGKLEGFPMLASDKADAASCLVLGAATRTQLRTAVSKGQTPLILTHSGERHLMTFAAGKPASLAVDTKLPFPVKRFYKDLLE